MSDASSSSASPFSLEARKTAIEDEVFYKSLPYWERLQELEFLYNSGEATTPKMMAELREVREHLNIAVWVDVFKEGHIYQLMLQKELELLNGIASSHSFCKTSSSALSVWLRMWINDIEEKYENVIQANIYC